MQSAKGKVLVKSSGSGLRIQYGFRSILQDFWNAIAPSPRLASSAPLSRVPGEGKIENDLTNCLMKGKTRSLYI